MSGIDLKSLAIGVAAGAGIAYAALRFAAPAAGGAGGVEWSLPDQEARFNHEKKIDQERRMHLERFYKRSAMKGKRVLVTGCTRGLGKALAGELAACGAHVYATCRKVTDDLTALAAVAEANGGSLTIIPGLDVRDDGLRAILARYVTEPLDLLINNAGYFKRERESILHDTMDFPDEIMTIDICSIGMLRVTNALYHCGALKEGSHVAFVTSQGGSVEWRDAQCPNGGDYGHHMSKSAGNMAGKLVANELREKGISVSVLHPGMVRTEMTAKYSADYDKCGAMSAEVAAKRMLHECTLGNLGNTGRYINCEDGLPIPW
mmetsp:Transcript_21599/g.75894  ORF Transcript_21599/g.75894 Transcript_21599/m.75894 type:complete len:319 (-) Transcript_21599:69-1025(-)